MAIPESQLETWSHQGAVTSSADTYAATSLSGRVLKRSLVRVARFYDGRPNADKRFAVMELQEKLREEEGHFEIWGRMLDRRAEIERSRNSALRFVSRILDGTKVTFELRDPITWLYF